MIERIFPVDLHIEPLRIRYDQVIPAALGNTQLREVNVFKTLAIPFMGADHAGVDSRLGVGVLLPDEKEAYFFGYSINRWLIQPWRAMKLLDKMDKMDDRMLRICSIATDYEKTLDSELMLHLSMSVGTPDFIDSVMEVMTLYPKESELLSIIQILQFNHIHIDRERLRKELSAANYGKRVVEFTDRKAKINLN